MPGWESGDACYGIGVFELRGHARMEGLMLKEDMMTLMENFWILREQDNETYYRLKEREEGLRPFWRKS